MNRLVNSSLTRSLCYHRLFLLGANMIKNQQKWYNTNIEEEEESWKSMEGMIRCPANDVPLTPISFLERCGKVFGDRASIVYGSLKYTWGDTHLRCIKLASALAHLGISHGDVVSFFPNIHYLMCVCVCVFFIFILF